MEAFFAHRDLAPETRRTYRQALIPLVEAIGARTSTLIRNISPGQSDFRVLGNSLSIAYWFDPLFLVPGGWGGEPSWGWGGSDADQAAVGAVAE